MQKSPIMNRAIHSLCQGLTAIHFGADAGWIGRADTPTFLINSLSDTAASLDQRAAEAMRNGSVRSEIDLAHRCARLREVCGWIAEGTRARFQRDRPAEGDVLFEEAIRSLSAPDVIQAG